MIILTTNKTLDLRYPTYGTSVGFSTALRPDSIGASTGIDDAKGVGINFEASNTDNIIDELMNRRFDVRFSVCFSFAECDFSSSVASSAALCMAI